MAEGTTLPAGRELDEVRERIAEFMGTLAYEWVIEGCSRSRGYETREAAEADRPRLAEFYLMGPLVLSGDVPDYPTDIAAAWTVLEKLRADGKIDMASVSVGEHGWWCVLYPPLGSGRLSVESDYCDAAAEAICYAALATLPPAGAR